jgi:HPt (histidine-containing phosphotransfer) domain-containing protein
MAPMLDRTMMAGATALERKASPPLVPDDQPIDFSHLFRMTLGDHSLEREVLQLFARQAEMLIARMSAGAPAAAAALAHTLKGSARGIGAWTVASAAEQVEIASAGSGELAPAIEALSRAIEQARATIAGHLIAG